MKKLVLLVLALVCVGNGLALAADWPQWRGPNRDGVSMEKGLQPAWPDGGPQQLWQAKGLGKGYSSVAIAGARLYTIGAIDKDEYLVALDLKTHEVAWKALLGRANGDGPQGTPTVAGGLVYAIGKGGDLICAEADGGKEIWRKNFAKDFGGKMMSGWGYAESPLVDGAKLVCTPGSDQAAMVALDRKTGATIWKAALPDFSKKGKAGAGYSSIVLSEGAGVRQYVQLMGRGLVSVAAGDGKFLWGYDKIANGTANIPTPVVAGDDIFTANGYNVGAALLHLSAGAEKGSVQAEEVYFLPAKEFQNHHGGVVLVNGFIYGSHGQNGGIPTCLELKTGKIMWKGENLGKDSGAVVYADNRLYFRWQDGTLALVDAAPEAFKVRGSFKVDSGGGTKWAHPVVSGGKLYLRDGDTILCYDVSAGGKTQAEQASIKVSGDIAVSGTITK